MTSAVLPYTKRPSAEEQASRFIVLLGGSYQKSFLRLFPPDA